MNRGPWPVACGLVIIFLLSGHGSRVTGNDHSLVDQACAAWSSRDKPGQTVKAIELWSQASQAEPQRVDILIALSKAQGRAVRHATTSRDRKYWADEARSTAEKAVKLARSNAEAHTALGEALGQWARAHKGTRSLGAVRDAIENLELSVMLDPKLAYAHMLLAEFYRQSPRFISVGNKKKALTHAELAAAHGPKYAINHLVLARAYLEFGRKEEAIAELEKILHLTPPADAIPETRADQETAQEMLQSLGKKADSSGCTEGNACTEKL